MPKQSTPLLLTALVLAVAAARPAAAHDPTPRRATLATFAGYWWGHTRGLEISKTGHARERISDGCCTFVIDYRFQLLRPRGTVAHASVAFRVTRVRLYNKDVYWAKRRAPRVGQLGELRLRHGVVTDSLTGTNFCAPRVVRCGA